MRSKNYHFVSARPTLESVMHASISKAQGSAISVPARFSLELKDATRMLFRGFSGSYSIGEKENQSEIQQDWDLQKVGPSVVKLRIESGKDSDVVLHAEIQARAAILKLSNRTIGTFWTQFVQAFVFIWSYSLTIAIVGGLYAGLLVLWIAGNKK